MHWSPDMLMRMRPSGKTVSVIESQGVCNYGRRGVLLSLFNFSHLYKKEGSAEVRTFCRKKSMSRCGKYGGKNIRCKVVSRGLPTPVPKTALFSFPAFPTKWKSH